MVRLKGFEPPTFWFVAKHSIQLSYSRISRLSRQPSYTSTSLCKMQGIFAFVYVFFSNCVRHFGQVMRSFPRCFGTRSFSPQEGHLK